MFGASALYHRPNWGPKGRAVMRRVDHAAIFALIAGTNTPLALIALPPDQARRVCCATEQAPAAGAWMQACLPLLAHPRRRALQEHNRVLLAPNLLQCTRLLTLVWSGAALGIVNCLFFSQAPKWLASAL